MNLHRTEINNVVTIYGRTRRRPYGLITLTIVYNEQKKKKKKSYVQYMLPTARVKMLQLITGKNSQLPRCYLPWEYSTFHVRGWI